MSQTPQNKKPPIPCSPPFDIDPIQRIHTQAQSILYMKYNTIYNNNDYIQTYYLIFNEKCRAVARFNDYLILDDNTEFLKRYYPFEEVLPKLKTIFAFYETYSKIFPNYMILQESECLYRNIRKKQKMIDAFNQIKKEEEENRERLKIGKKNNNSNSGCNSNNNNNIVFDKNVQNSINKCEPSVVNCRCVDGEDSVNSISISLLSRKCMCNAGNNVFKTPGSSFVNEDNSFASIAVIIQGMDNKNNVVVPMETPKKKKKVNDKELLCEDNNNNNNVIDDSLASLNEFNNNNNDHNTHHHIQSALNNNRKFISHKSTASVPEINNSIKIINNYHKIIIPQGTTNAVININAHIYPNDNNNNNTKPTTLTTVNNNNNTQSPSTTTKGSSTASKQSNTLTHNSNSNNNNNIYTHSNFQLSNPDTITISNHMKSSSKIDTHKNITIKNFQTNMLTHNNNNNNTNTNSKSLSKCKNYSMQKNNTNSYLNTQSSVHNNNKGNITTEGNNIVNGSCTINNKSLSKSKHHTHYTTTTTTNTKIDFAITKSAFKSPEKILSLSKKKNITTTVSTTNHIKPIYKNKNLSNIQTLSALQNTKVNPFKTKFERKKSIQKHNTSNSLNTNVNTNNKHKQQVTQVNNTSHHEVINSFINQNSIFKKEIRTSLINVDTIDTNNTKDTITNNDKQCKSKHEHLSMRKYNGNVNVDVGSLRMFGVGFKHNHISTSSSNKLQQHSIEVNNYNCKGNNNNNNNNNACSQRKPANLKTPVVKKVVMSPKNNNYVDKGNRAALTEKVKLTQKCPLNREMIKQNNNNNNICVNGNSNSNNPSKIIRSFGSKGVDANTTKMKFLRK